MHEETLFRDLRAKLVEVAEIEHAPRIARVEIWLGALSHVTEDHLRSEWSELVKGTPAEGSALTVVVSEEPSDPRARSLVMRSVAVATEGKAA